MKITTTSDEDRFLARGSNDFYHVSVAVDAFQKAALRTLREVTDEFDSKLTRLGLAFKNARERKGLGPHPWIQRQIRQQHLEAGITLVWYDPDETDNKGRQLCVYWWI